MDVQQLARGDVDIAGPFLDGLEISGVRPFEDWKDEYRARLLPQLRDCLVRQMDAARRIGDFATVERRAGRLWELDALAEEAVRGIMEARAWAGDRSNALKAFGRYEAQLAEGLGAKPSADLCRVADLLRDGRRPAAKPSSVAEPAPPVARRFEPETLIGREREFSVLYDAWLDARRKQPRIVVLTSDPGVGKTTLANAFVSSCQMDGAVVARAQAYDAERELPFAVLGELVRQLAAQRAIGGADPEALSELTRISSEIVRVFPGVPKPVEWSPELTPLRLADAFLKTVMAAAEDSPVVLVIDDIHAADNASTAILHVVARKLVGVRVLMILAGRTSELRLSDAPAALTSDTSIDGLRALEMDVLSREAAEQLVRQLAAQAEQPDPPVERILRASGGNPLAIELLTREWAAHGAASLLRDLEALDTRPVPAIGIPRAIGVVFERQVRRLEPALRAALHLSAILGRRLAQLDLYNIVELASGQAAEALSRLTDDGFLREIRGDLEFRNELIRAQAYYSITATARQHLHRRVAEILDQTSEGLGQSAGLEIAWHYLRSGAVQRALPFALDGAEAFLAVGAPHEAEEVLQAIWERCPDSDKSRRVRILLAKALIEQSKADPALPIMERLFQDSELTPHERAELARLRASAEFSLNRDPEKYFDAARIALTAAKATGDSRLISRALFECARAGSEGMTELVDIAEREVDDLTRTVDVHTIPIALLTKAFCRFFFLDPAQTLAHLGDLLALRPQKLNPAELALVYSGIGIAYGVLARFVNACDAFTTALTYAKRVGDDSRISQIASNLCTMHMNRGNYEESIRYGQMAVRLGESSSSGSLMTAYTNLMDPYLLRGDHASAAQCLEKARKWLGPKRRWKLKCAFYSEAASFALVQQNQALALDIISQLEVMTRGLEEAVPMPGSYWKLRVFREAHVGSERAARELTKVMMARFKQKCPCHYLDLLGVKGWLERRMDDEISFETEQELQLFGSLGALGRKELLTAQGFLSPASDGVTSKPIGRDHSGRQGS
ncbi:MAG: ATP-binding protein [Gammaproteobacteria bacterium]